MTAITLLSSAAMLLQQVLPLDVPFRFGQDAIIVDSVVNGKPASLMFDTGFSGAVVIDSSLNIGEPTGKMTLRDFVGQFETETVKLKSLKLGKMAIDCKDMEAVKIPGEDNTLSYNTNCIGIMGYEVISKYVTEINFEKGKFVFLPNSVDITKRAPDNKRTFLAKLLPVGHNSLEMVVKAENGKSMILALDTGNAFYATTHRDVLERIGYWRQGREPKFLFEAGVASGTVTTWNARIKNISIYGVPVAECVMDIIDLPSSSAEHDGTVGFGFLKNFNITIDYARRRVWLENFTGKVANEPDGETGISAFSMPGSDKVIAYRISPESPAALAGMKQGDQILAMDGVDVTNVGFRRFRTYFDGPVGSKVKLAVSRAGQLLRFDIERKLLVNDVPEPGP